MPCSTAPTTKGLAICLFSDHHMRTSCEPVRHNKCIYCQRHVRFGHFIQQNTTALTGVSLANAFVSNHTLSSNCGMAPCIIHERVFTGSHPLTGRLLMSRSPSSGLLLWIRHSGEMCLKPDTLDFKVQISSFLHLPVCDCSLVSLSVSMLTLRIHILMEVVFGLSTRI